MLIVGALLVGAGLAAVTVALIKVSQEAAVRRELAIEGVGEVPTAVEPESDAPLIYRLGEPVLAGGARVVRRISPARRVELLRRRLQLAGMDGRVSVERILGFQAVGAVVGILLGIVARPGPIAVWLWAPFLGLIGYFVPEAVIASRADNRQKAIGRDLPEAIDLMAITVEAGLGLEQAIQIVTENVPGPLGAELHRLLREIGLGVSRRDALSALRDRVEVEELSTFIVALIQADRMGVSIGEVLKVQAGQIRLRRRQRAREQAAKTPVKILFPVIFGVLPTLFIVTLGPAAINILQAFKGH